MNPQEQQIYDILHPDAVGRRLTAHKAADIVARGTYKVTGVIVRDDAGRAGIVEGSAVRWLSRADFWELMHPSQKP